MDPSLDTRGAVAVSFGKGKDGKETVWRTVGEGVAPEMINLAEGIGCK